MRPKKSTQNKNSIEPTKCVRYQTRSQRKEALLPKEMNNEEQKKSPRRRQSSMHSYVKQHNKHFDKSDEEINESKLIQDGGKDTLLTLNEGFESSQKSAKRSSTIWEESDQESYKKMEGSKKKSKQISYQRKRHNQNTDSEDVENQGLVHENAITMSSQEASTGNTNPSKRKRKRISTNRTGGPKSKIRKNTSYDDDILNLNLTDENVDAGIHSPSRVSFSSYIDDELEALLKEDEKSKEFLNEYRTITTNRKIIINSEKERIHLETLRLSIEEAERQRKERELASKESEKRENLIDEALRPFFNRDLHFFDEILYRPIFQEAIIAPSRNTKDEDKEENNENISKNTSSFELLVELRSLTHYIQADEELVDWLLKKALPIRNATDESTENVIDLDSEVSQSAYDTLVSSVILQSQSAIVPFKNLSTIIENCLGVYSITRRFACENDDQLHISIPSNDTLERFERVLHIIQIILKYKHFTAEELSALFYLVCNGATLGDAQLCFLVGECLLEFSKIHKNDELSWEFPSVEEFTTTFPFIRNNLKYTWVYQILHTMICTHDPIIALNASHYARNYCDSIVNVSNYPYSHLPMKTTSKLSDWISSLMNWQVSVHKDVLKVVDSGFTSAMQTEVKKFDNLYWILRFFFIGVFNRNLYLDTLKGHLLQDEISRCSKKIGYGLNSLLYSGNLHMGDPSVSRYSLFVTHVVDLWEFYFKQHFI